tara:strand:- start:304 stop:795 length:492 start_codon:yes stop_codon:yes gene_type:complete
MFNQLVFDSNNSLKKLRLNVLKDNPKNILLFTGKKSFKSSGAQEKINEALKDFSFFRYSDFNINPSHSDLIKCLNLLKGQTFDYIISVGGGSVIDFAKLVNIGLHNNQVFTNFPNHINEIKKKVTSLLLFLQPQDLGLRQLILPYFIITEKNSQYLTNFYILI